MVTRKDVTDALKRLGIEETDTVIFHSSLKSFGKVEDGPVGIIDGIKEALKEGTVVFPALVSTEFHKAYENWDIDNTPSEVGLIAETFRKQEGVLRSDQATHSVTAMGKHAEYITSGHCDGKERFGVFGNTPFSHTSPWQKMYDLDGKVVMLGVTMVYNTFKHFVEYSVVEDILESLEPDAREKAKGELSSYEDISKLYSGESDSIRGVWLWNDGDKEQAEMSSRGLIRQTKCGESTLTAFKIKDFYNFLYTEFIETPEEWLPEAAAEWVRRYKK